MMFAPVDVPDDVRREALDARALPRKWYVYPAPRQCQAIGDDWVRRGETVALIVPSAVARVESNVLLNPAHRDFGRLIVGAVESMRIDQRLSRR